MVKKNEVTRVLIAEDDDDDHYLVTGMLNQDPRHQYSMGRCKSVKQCCEMLRQHEWDVLLLDLGLQDTPEQGVETLNLILAEQIAVPVIVLTGSSNDELGDEAVRAGAEDYIPKAEANTSLLSRSIVYAIERHRLLTELKQEAITDSLTGLPNRSAMMERIGFLIDCANRSPFKLAVAMLDLDGFKPINDEYGHRVGDDLLRLVASRFKKELRSSDMIARFGGDEFVLLMTHYQCREDLVTLLERKRQKLSEPASLQDAGKVIQVQVGVSIGVAEWQPELTAQKLLVRADTAMYQSKNNGKNTLTFYED